MKTLLTAALLASAIAFPMSASAAELVVNGGFESPNGLNNGWSYVVSNTLSVEVFAPAAHSGDGSLRMAADSLVFDDFLYQTLTTQVGKTYHYSFFLESGTTDPTADSAFLAEIGGVTVAYLSGGPSFGYTQTSGDFVATSTSTDIYFEAYNSLGLYQLDDVSVTGPVGRDCGRLAPCGGGGGAGTDGGVPEPATWALMIMGFGGVGAMLRNRQALAGRARA